MTNTRQNLFFAFIYNVLGVPIAAGVLCPFVGLLLSAMIASAAMTFGSVSVRQCTSVAAGIAVNAARSWAIRPCGQLAVYSERGIEPADHQHRRAGRPDRASGLGDAVRDAV